MKREVHSDSDSSDNSQCDDPSTSDTAAVVSIFSITIYFFELFRYNSSIIPLKKIQLNDQTVQALNQNVRSASSTPPLVRDQNRPKNDKMPRPNSSERETSRNSGGIFDENRRAVRSQETTVRHSTLKSVQDSNKHVRN